MKKNYWEKPYRYIHNKKVVFTVYFLLRLLVVLTMILQLFNGNYQNVFVCILTLILFMLPSIIEHRLRIDLPDALDIIVIAFIFSANILGEIKEFYVLVPHWDTTLHTINGFLFAAIGFSVVNIFNENKRISMTLSPFYMAIAAFCFSMTIGILWEFFEWGADSILGFDMQKDTVINTISSVMLNPDGKNQQIVVGDIVQTTLTLADGSQYVMNIEGYLDIGLLDTMKDLLVNMVGAVVFSFFGYFYIKTKGKGKIAKMFIPEVIIESAEDSANNE